MINRKRKQNSINKWESSALQRSMVDVYMKKIVDLCTFLAKDYNEQLEQTEEFVRWNLPDEIGLEWMDAEYVVLQAPELQSVLSEEQRSILCEIYDNFLSMFNEKANDKIRTHAAMQSHPFWQNQRVLAERFLKGF